MIREVWDKCPYCKHDMRPGHIEWCVSRIVAERRDRFAAAALTGLLASGKPIMEPEPTAGFCALMADGLIAELDKKP